MEETDPEMKELEARQRSLGRVFDSLNLQASSVLLFTSQWKDLEDHFESTRNKLRTRLEDLEERVKLVAAVEAKAVITKAESAARAKELAEIEEVLEKKRREVEEERGLIRVSESECVKMERLVKERSRKLSWIERSAAETARRVEMETVRLGEVRREVEECERELEWKEERVKVVENSIANFYRILESKERLNGVVDLKMRDLASLKKSMEEWCWEIEKKKTVLEECVAKMELEEERVERRIEEVSLLHDKFLDEVEVKEKEKENHLEEDSFSLQRFMDKHLKGIDSFGTKLSAILRDSCDAAKLVLDAMLGFYPDDEDVDYDLRVRRRGCCLLLRELKRMSPQISPQVREEAMKLAADWKGKMKLASDTDLELLGFLRFVVAYDLGSVYDVKELKSLHSSVSLGQQASHIGQPLGIASPASLQSSVDPATLVLGWMQTEFSQYWTGDVCLEPTLIRTCIFRLEQLMRDSPHVEPHVQEDARKLVFQWKAKMRVDAENAWEILGFLHFIAAYRLASTLTVDEIVKLLGMITQHKQALEFWQTLPSEAKIPGEFINCLVEKKQLMDAVELICLFKLTNKFHPVPLLKEYVEEKMKSCRDGYAKEKLHDEKVKVVDQHITDLRAVVTLIKDYNLELEYPFSNVEREITRLDQVKEKWRTVKPENMDKSKKSGTKRHSSTPPAKLKPQQQPYKSHRTSALPSSPHPLQPYPLVNLHQYSSPALQPYPLIQNAGIHHTGSSYHRNLPSWNYLCNLGNPFFRF